MDVGFMPPSSAGFGTMIFDIMAYANTNVFKTVLGQWETQNGLSTQQFVLRQVGLWRSASAITSTKFTFATGNVVSGSTFSLFGIKASA
jgi:hypothetical protein